MDTVLKQDNTSLALPNADPRRAAVFAALASLGVDFVIVDYFGEGDNGRIDKCEAMRDDAEVDITFNITFASPQTGQELTQSLSDACMDMADDILGFAHPGYRDDNGSEGSVYFFAKTYQLPGESEPRNAGEILLAHNWRSIELTPDFSVL